MNYRDYKKLVEHLMYSTKENFQYCLDEDLVVEREYNMNGEPYRYLTIEEFQNRQQTENK